MCVFDADSTEMGEHGYTLAFPSLRTLVFCTASTSHLLAHESGASSFEFVHSCMAHDLTSHE